MKQAILGTVAALSLLTAVPSFAGELYDQGLRDRILWENWFLSLYGDKRTGAEYWASQRSLSNPGNCLGTSDFQRGCSEAKARLTPFDVVRKSQPEYRLGWNAYIPPASLATGSPSLPPWEQEERTRQQEITTRALEAENARRQADLQSREIAARAARAEADRVKAEVSRRKAEQEATDARRLIPLSQVLPHLAFEEGHTRSGACAGVFRAA
jgi:hypothetical protein